MIEKGKLTNSSLLFEFIDEIKEDQNKFIQERIEIEPITRIQLTQLIKNLELEISSKNSYFVLNLHANACEKILDYKLAKNLLSRENIQVIIKNKRFFFEAIKDEDERARILSRLVSLDKTQLENLISALKKAPEALSTKKSFEKKTSTNDFEFAVIETITNGNRPMSRSEIAQEIGIESTNDYLMKKLSNILICLSSAGKIMHEGERINRRYFSKRVGQNKEVVKL